MKFSNIFSVFRNRHMNRSELAVLRVSMLVAALDGEVSDSELSEFRNMAENCEGYSPEETEKALADTLRSTGYLMLLARLVDRKKLLDAFITEAEQILPVISNYGKDGIQGAVAVWKQMAGADDDFSDVEREAIDYLEKFLVSRNEYIGQALNGNLGMVSPAGFHL